MIDTETRSQITAVVLAGGLATRMGGEDKGLVRLGRMTMVELVIRALRPQVSEILINANRNIERYQQTGLTVIRDFYDGYFGPLAGMASALRVARTPLVLVVPCDSPFICMNLAARLHKALTNARAELAVAHSGERLEPVFALLLRTLQQSLVTYLDAGDRKIDLWYHRHAMVSVDFSDQPEMFRNLNTPEDVEAATQQLATEQEQRT